MQFLVDFRSPKYDIIKMFIFWLKTSACALARSLVLFQKVSAGPRRETVSGGAERIPNKFVLRKLIGPKKQLTKNKKSF